MSLSRVFTRQTLEAGAEIELEAEASHHLGQVLRMQPGGEVLLFDGSGREYAAVLLQLRKHQVSVRLIQLTRFEEPPALRIHLFLGISRGERMEFALQKAVELGVSAIQPVFTKRCMVKLSGDRLEGRMEHWRKIIGSACEQSGRCLLPELAVPLPLADALGTRTPGSALLLDPYSTQRLADLTRPTGAVILLVGPEGGLSDEERELALNQGFTGVRLGPRILRTETAPLAAIAAIQTLWGDF